MHVPKLLLALLLSLPLTLWANPAHSGHGSHDAAASQAAKPVVTRGLVLRIDARASSVTIRHEPIASLGWPAMTMKFKLARPQLAGKLKPEQIVGFEFVQQGADYVITKVN